MRKRRWFYMLRERKEEYHLIQKKKKEFAGAIAPVTLFFR